MHPDNLPIDCEELQKVFLLQNRVFLDAVRTKMPLEEILLQYDKVKSLFDTMQLKNSFQQVELG